jgi:hypothetical protein
MACGHLINARVRFFPHDIAISYKIYPTGGQCLF